MMPVSSLCPGRSKCNRYFYRATSMARTTWLLSFRVRRAVYYSLRWSVFTDQYRTKQERSSSLFPMVKRPGYAAASVGDLDGDGFNMSSRWHAPASVYCAGSGNDPRVGGTGRWQNPAFFTNLLDLAVGCEEAIVGESTSMAMLQPARLFGVTFIAASAQRKPIPNRGKRVMTFDQNSSELDCAFRLDVWFR